jgi:REP element-mobilizing transposase RayT
MSSYPTRRHQRLQGYDYSSAGCYFVTLCVQDRLPLLGRIAGGEMLLSPAGAMVQLSLQEMPRRYSDVNLDALVVMPDHLHVIVTLGGGGRSLSTVMHRVKSQTTAIYGRKVWLSGWPPFHVRLWQRGFYDRVIRDERQLNAIREYMMQNPLRWSLNERRM